MKMTELEIKDGNFVFEGGGVNDYKIIKLEMVVITHDDEWHNNPERDEFKKVIEEKAPQESNSFILFSQVVKTTEITFAAGGRGNLHGSNSFYSPVLYLKI